MLINVLQQIQQGTVPAPETIVIPTSQKLYEIDLSTRTISGPETLSIQSDHYAETVYFIVDRYYDHMDLAQTSCVVQYVANGESYVYAVPFCDITTYEGKMIIPWSISLSATKNAGRIKYFIKFYLVDSSAEDGEPKFTYSLNTLPATSTVLQTLPSEDFVAEDDVLGLDIELPERYLELVNTLAQMIDSATVYWQDV